MTDRADRMAESVLTQWVLSPRSNESGVEAALHVLYERMGLPSPRVQWRPSIFAAMRDSEARRPREVCIERDEKDVCQRCMEAYWELHTRCAEEKIEIQRELPGFQLAFIYSAARLEHQASMREARLARLGPKAFYREEIGEMIADDESSSVTSNGLALFHDRMSFIDLPILGLVQMEAHRRCGELELDARELALLDALVVLARDAYWVFLTEHEVFVAQPPETLRYDHAGQPHCVTAPALITRDGHNVYALNGVWVHALCVLEPECMTLKEIEMQPGEDTRARMIEAYGLERYLKETGAILWDKSSFGELYWKSQHQQSPLLAVRVKNSTPEPDGTFKHYMLRVPPHVATAREAVAWTFGLQEAEYEPQVES